MGGEATDAHAICDTCCQPLVACEQIADLRRATEWCRAVVDFSDSRRFTPRLRLARLFARDSSELAVEEARTAFSTSERLGAGGKGDEAPRSSARSAPRAERRCRRSRSPVGSARSSLCSARGSRMRDRAAARHQ